MANIKQAAPNTKKIFSFTAIASVVILAILVVLFVVSSLGTTNSYDRALFFSNRMDFSYDITKVELGNDGATLYNKGDKSDFVQINPIKLSSSDDQSNKILEFKEDSVTEGDSRIEYQVSVDEKTWKYYNGQKWAAVGACETCYNDADEVNNYINELAVSSKNLRMKVFMASDDDNVPLLRSIQFIIRGKDDGKAVSASAAYLTQAYNMEEILGSEPGSTYPSGDDNTCDDDDDDPTCGDGGPEACVYTGDKNFYIPLKQSSSGNYPSAGTSSDSVSLTSSSPNSNGFLNVDLNFSGIPDGFKNATLYIGFNDLDLDPDNISQSSGAGTLTETFTLKNSGGSTLASLDGSHPQDNSFEWSYDLSDSIFSGSNLTLKTTLTAALALTSGNKLNVSNSVDGMHNIKICGETDNGFECPEAVVQALLDEGKRKGKVHAWDFTFDDSWTGSGYSVSNNAIIHDLDSVHLSCSADYNESGYPDKGRPIEADGDPAVSAYSIVQWDVDLDRDKCEIKKECGDTFAPTCGNGVQEAGEQCDDGNNENGDGCSATCEIEVGPSCGDGNLDDGEECDDGNTNNGDGCSSACTIPDNCNDTCIDEYGCDNNLACSDGSCRNNACTSENDCVCATCGDGNIDDGEECDDGNNNNGDGCSATCNIESEEKITVHADKIFCEDEADLPNWGAGGPSITSTTAQDYANSKEGCSLQSGWQFQWSVPGVPNPGDNTGEAGAGWNTFGPTNGNGRASVEVPVENVNAIWFREVFQSGNQVFTYNIEGGNSNNVSAEFYCHTDSLNYDNWDYVHNFENGGTYYCLAFNTPAPVDLLPPVAEDDTKTTPYETPVDIDILDNDSDPDGVIVPSTVEILEQPTNGTLGTPDPGTGVVTYTPNPGFTGVDTFKYKVCDNDGLCDEAIVTVTVEEKELVPPVALDDTKTTPYETPVDIDILDNDSDPDGVIVPSTVEILEQPTNGTLGTPDPGTGVVTYTPNPGFTGVDTFKYKVCDDDGLCDEATVTVTVTEPDLEPPVALDDSETTDVNTPVDVNVLVNDSDPDGVLIPSTVVITPSGDPSNGTITNIDNATGVITYLPDNGFFGTDTFEYEVCDNDGLCDTALVTITINEPEPLPPVAIDDFEITQLNTPVDVDILDNDFDLDGDLVVSTITILDPPDNGSLGTPDPTTGVIIYTPDQDFFGTDTFVYQVCDNDGLCDTATVVIEIEEAEPIPPVAIDDFETTLVDTPIEIEILENDFDLDGVLIPSTVGVTTDPLNGTTSVNTISGTITYSPNSGFTGTDTFEYEVCDDDGLCDIALVTVVISEDELIPPTAIDDAIDTPLDTPVVIDLPDNDFDEDGTIVTTCMTIVSEPTNGTVSIDTATGLATYTPNTGFTGLDTFVYEICDNDDLFDTATVTVNVLPLDTPLVIPPVVLPDPLPVVVAPEVIGVDPAFCGVSYTSGTNAFTGTLAGDFDAATTLEYSLSNGLSWRSLPAVTGLGTGAATFSFTLDDYRSGDYNLIVRAIPEAGDVVGTIDCPFSIDLGDLIFGANEFVLTEQQGPMVANGLIQFRKDEPQRLWIEAKGATVFNIQDIDNIDRVFPLTYDEDVKLWTGELVFDETGVFRLEGQISNSIGGAYSREINSVFVTEGRDIIDYKTEELIDASVIIYEKDTFTGNFVVWNGSAYGQANPYTTDGQLSLILPQGEFYIEISHPEYNTITSLITVIDDQSLVRAEVRMLKNNIIDRLTSLVDADDVSNNFPLELIPLPDFGLLEVGEVVPDIIGDGEDTGTYSLLDVLDEDKYTVLMMYSDWNTESQEQIEIYSDLLDNYLDVIGDVQFAEISTMPPAEVELTYLERGEYDDVTYFEPNNQFYDDYMIISLPHFMVLNPDREFLGQVVGSYPASELADLLADIIATDQ